MTTAPLPPVTRRRPRPSREVSGNFAAIVVINGLLAIGLWLRHGGLSTNSGAGGAMTSIGQVTGLVGAYLVLVQLLLMARIPWVEREVGFDRLAIWHRWNGFAATWLLLVHAVTITVGYAQSNRASVPGQFLDFINHYPDVLMAIVATGLLIAIAVTSVRRARAKIDREAWYFVHLYAYLAVALGFAHQLAVGTDFVDDPVARTWWIALYVVVVGALLVWRVAQPVWFNVRHQLRVSKVSFESPDVISIYVTGRDLRGIDAQPGQFFLWRFLTRDRWWQAHPFSLSEAPRSNRLRITVKALGDYSHDLRSIAPGTRVFAEGPYGAFTAEQQTSSKVLLIAGGIGITPVRALLESVDVAHGDVTLLYRVEHEQDLVFWGELGRLAQERGVAVYPLVGPEIGDDQTDRLGLPALRSMVPDIHERDVFLCGPPGLVDVVVHRLHRLGVPRHQIHAERFAY
ncbi:MAG TPA: ferredoxin reductase family protein [Acidimicrobiales bacterium]|nr:ferredoxin reductase family protein [Acidimicrobiales bacterium]